MAPSHYGPELHQVTRCHDCGMVFTNPQVLSYEQQVENTGVLTRHLMPERLRSAELQARLQTVKQTVLLGGCDPCFDDFFEQERMPDGCKNPWTALIKSCWKTCEERPDVQAVVSCIEKLLDKAAAH